MKILITTGIYPPESGGPATYVQNLAKILVKQGHQIMVITYSDENYYDGDDFLSYKLIRIKRSNKLFNYLKFFKAIMRNIKDFDMVYCIDHFSAGIPSVLVSKFQKKKIAIRVGGDFIWERYSRITEKGVSLRDYYDQNLYQKDWLRFWIIKLVFKFTDLIIFTTKFQKEIFENPYKLKDSKIKFIGNASSNISVNDFHASKNNEILWAGRMIKLKNLEKLIKAFSEINNKQYTLSLIGDGEIKKELQKLVQENNLNNIKFIGKISRKELNQKIKTCYAFVLPSYTDISPNVILECIHHNIPFIITKEHGFDFLKNKALAFDPNNQEELKKCLNKIIDDQFYNEYKKQISEIEYNYFYQDIAEDTIKLFKEIL
ncbi:glycosyltransferase family 4 protein [bacterium]|nr:glycosyltransferase family 4 protein [bacterium]